MNKKILITGGAGFIGSHLVEAYLAGGYQVTVLDKKIEPPYLKSLPINYYQQDINQAGIEEIFEKERPEIINHHAALINVAESMENPLSYTQTNVLATIKLLELGKKYQISQFIFPSSAAVYGEINKLPIKEDNLCAPDSFYGLDKLLAEYYVKTYKPYFATTIFRYGNVFGPRQIADAEGGVVAIFCQNLAKQLPCRIYGDGQQTRDFVYVKDVALANVAAATKHISGLMHVSTGVMTSINQLYINIANLADNSSLPIYEKTRKGDIKDSVLDNSVIQNILNWRPETTLAKGLSETWEYFLK